MVQPKHSKARPFKCEFPGCHHTSEKLQHLLYHNKVHSNARPFACPNGGCNYRAKRKSEITRHVQFGHSQAKTFACTKCDYKTAEKSDLKLHMRRHSSRPDFKSSHPQCTESFKSSPDLNLDFRNHEEKNEKISCLVKGCEYKGKNRKALEEHIRSFRHKAVSSRPAPGSVQKSTNKEAVKVDGTLPKLPGLFSPLQCFLCLKHYPTVDQLQSHSAAHTSEKPFVCGHCEYAACEQADVKLHVSSAHGNIEFPFIVYLLDKRECLRCNVILPIEQFRVHCNVHTMRVQL